MDGPWIKRVGRLSYNGNKCGRREGNGRMREQQEQGTLTRTSIQNKPQVDRATKVFTRTTGQGGTKGNEHNALRNSLTVLHFKNERLP
jgi:hypothetical protein